MRNLKLGIIGGGQLGMLLLQKALEFPLHVKVLDPSSSAPAASFCGEFVQGDLTDYATVMDFGSDCDLISFEIEKANLQALKDLKSQGKRVICSPESLEWIQDKGLQREIIAEHNFSSPQFTLIAANDIYGYDGPFPIVQKFRRDGYDGKGVNILKSVQDLSKIPAVDSVFEEMIDIDKELSVIVARNSKGETAVYQPSEMIFDQRSNMLDLMITPARIPAETSKKLQQIALEMAEKLQFEGIYAIETFLAKNGDIYINEIAPRPHNSGHHTIAANACSQYEQQLRILLDLPLGSTKMLSPSVLLNLVGSENADGKTNYQGLEKVMSLENCQFTFYGKDEVKPFRKMGHVCILENEIDLALKKAETIKQQLIINSK